MIPQRVGDGSPTRRVDPGLRGTRENGPSRSQNVTPNTPTYKTGSNPFKDAVEPTPKRRKLDGESESTPRSAGPIDLDFSRASIFQGAGSPTKSSPTVEDAHRVQRQSLFPLRPHVVTEGRRSRQTSALAIERAKMKESVPLRPYVPEPPACAPRFQDDTSSDFFPWTGHHPEDVLNELSTKNGFYDKGFQTESLSLRPSLLSSLKNKSGPKILSSLFVSVLDQRQEHGLITAASTFKPPPRVTLTDAKREAWLRDLANSVIPLRRLSRTIPHGIRGKMLLDQCLSKGIPLSRAIWLIKCVGANEIRAFKRKGAGGVFTVGGESKWVQDWTMNVEQFLDGLTADCGSPEWKNKVSYGLRLLSHIFDERLLERGQYLRWLIDRLEKSPLEDLPFWFLLMQLHKKQILRNREHGRRLTAALLGHTRETLKPHHEEVYKSLRHELVMELRRLMKSSLTCFLSPRCWLEYEDFLRQHVVGESEDLRKRFESMAKRNRNLKDPTFSLGDDLLMSLEQRIARVLDSTAKSHDWEVAAKTCLELTSAHGSLVSVCIRWATNSSRIGLFRIYAATRILGFWRRNGLALQDHIHEFLASMKEDDGTEQALLRGLTTELIRSEDFSVGKYCQWLLARGTTLRQTKALRPEARLLYGLPVQGLPLHVRNLRRSLLRSLKFSIQSEEALMNEAKTRIRMSFSNIFPQDNQDTAMTDIEQSEEPYLSNMISQHEIAQWVRIVLDEHMGNHDPPEASNDEVTAKAPLGFQDFVHLRSLFEQLQMFSVFADVLKTCARSWNTELLAAIADTVNYHYDNFTALKVTTSLFDTLYARAQMLPGLKEIGRSFTQSLVDLCTRLPERRRELRRLRRDFLVDLKVSAAAPSPISDNMIEAIDSNTLGFADEMEQLLANGASIDEATLSRAFESISRRYQMSWEEPDLAHDRCPELLCRLRLFNPTLFDSLMSTWIESLIVLKSRPQLSLLLQPMICSNVVKLKSILEAVARVLPNQSQSQAAAAALEVTDLLSSMHDDTIPTSVEFCYRFLQQLQRCLRDSPETVLTVLSVAFEAYQTTDRDFQGQAANLFNSLRFKSLLRVAMCQISIRSSCMSQIAPPLQATLRTILHHQLQTQSAVQLKEQLGRLLAGVNSLNLSLFQLEIAHLSQSNAETSESVPTVVADLLMEESKTASRLQTEIWSKLVSALPRSDTMQVRERVDQEVFLILDDLIQSGSISDDLRRTASSLINLVAASGLGLPATNSSLVLQLSLKLTTIASTIKSRALDQEQSLDSQGLDVTFQTIAMILQLLTVNQSTIAQASFPQDELLQICLTLAQLNNYMSKVPSPAVLNLRVLDVLILLSDSLTESSRSRCLRTLQELIPEQPSLALRFVFGGALDSAQGDDDCQWLRLVSMNANTNNTATTTAATTPNPISSSLAPAAAAPAAAFDKAFSGLAPLPGISVNKEEKTPQQSSMMTTVNGEPFPLRRWELVQDAMPSVTENDACLSLTLFGARKSVL